MQVRLLMGVRRLLMGVRASARMTRPTSEGGPVFFRALRIAGRAARRTMARRDPTFIVVCIQVRSIN